MGGRAAWPTVRLTCGAEERSGAAPRGHARDDIAQSMEDRENGSKKVFIKNLQDVAHSSFELYPENSAKFYFFRFRKKIPNSARAKN